MRFLRDKVQAVLADNSCWRILPQMTLERLTALLIFLRHAKSWNLSGILNILVLLEIQIYRGARDTATAA